VPVPERLRLTFVAPDEAALRRAEGRYRDEDRGSEHDLRLRGGRVTFGQWPLLALGPSTLFSLQDYARVDLVEENGTVAALDWIRPDGTHRWSRIAP
jgi:hypothetical protein